MKTKTIELKLLALFILFVTCFFVLAKNFNALLTDDKVVDTNTYNTYNRIIDESNIGQVWTDKSIFNEDIPFGEDVISKDEDEEFLVSLSALSTGIDLNLKEGNVKDIVILQDISGSMSSSVTSTSGSMPRLDASKNAINELLEVIAGVNDSLNPDDEKFKVSLITFEDNANVLFDLTEINAENLSGLQTIVNGMRDTGGTNITPGLNASLSQLQTNGRNNIDSAIITFLDGDDSNSSSVISLANTIKNEHGIVMYSIILNNDATGGTSSTIDKLGQGLSSNFDHATSTSNLGERTGNTYYYIPKTANELIDSFKSILKTIQKKVYTIEKGTYLTFTDTLGDYMEINRIKALVYNDTIYSNVEASIKDDMAIYKFSNEVIDALGNEANTDAIEIQVRKRENAEEGDTITIKIPYNLVPLATYDVTSTFLTDSTVYTTELNNANPISLIYSINAKNEIYSLYKANDAKIKEYIKDNGYVKDYVGYAYFYSNYYKTGKNGTTEVSFTPFRHNDYYYFTDDTLLYTKSEDIYNLYSGLAIDEDETYYTKKTIYNVGTKIESSEEYVKVSEVSGAQKDKLGRWYISDGTKKDIATTEAKKTNLTETASNLVDTKWNGKKIETLLGNNGASLIKMDVDRINIKVTKYWDDANNTAGKRPDSVVIRLKANGEDLGEDYKETLSNDNNWTYTYLDLPYTDDNGEEIKYTITEDKVAGYQTTIEGDQTAGFKVINSVVIENPQTGAFISIVEIIILGMLGVIILRYTQKKNRFNK